MKKSDEIGKSFREILNLSGVPYDPERNEVEWGAKAAVSDRRSRRVENIFKSICHLFVDCTLQDYENK